MGMYTGYLSDKEMEAICSEERQVRRMLAFEIALAKAEAAAGLIDKVLAEEIETVLAQLTISPDTLAESTLKNGVPTLGLLAGARAALSPAAADALHLGATSQDVMDTAAVLMWREALELIETRISALAASLLQLLEKHGNTPCIARTRGQQATPVPFGLKVANWGLPLARHIERLSELRKRLLAVQLGGGSGALSVLGGKGTTVRNDLARELGLQSASPWHAQRDSVAELGNWLALLTGSLGKMALDLLLMAQTEVGEVSEGEGGKSSAMPHKSNPVLSEAGVGLSKSNFGLAAVLQQSVLHAGERDGTAWMQEWNTLPQLLINTATALKHADAIVSGLKVKAERMRSNIGLTNGLVYAEQALAILSTKMKKSEAKKLVDDACQQVSESKSLAQVLSVSAGSGINWEEALVPEACFGSSAEVVEAAREALKGIL